MRFLLQLLVFALVVFAVAFLVLHAYPLTEPA